MPELHSYTPEMIDAAWQDALDTNKAFDAYYSAQSRLDRVREVAGFAIDGITVEDKVFVALEAQVASTHANFEDHMAVSSPVMTALDSPFRLNYLAPLAGRRPEEPPRTIEQVIDRSSPVCRADELREFALLRGYNPNIGSRAFSVLSLAGENVEVAALADYAPTSNPGQLYTIIYKNGKGYREWVIDRAGILPNARAWTNAKPDIRNLGATLISFLADYCNHAYPELDAPLPVTHPPKQKTDLHAKADAERAALKELGPRELLLDKVNILGEGEIELVTDRSLKRHALSLGYTWRTVPQYGQLFASIKRRAAPNDHPRVGVTAPHRVSDWLVFTGEHEAGSSWGITPEGFRDLIGRFEESPSLQKGIDCYTEFARRIIKQYLVDLEAALPAAEIEEL